MATRCITRIADYITDVAQKYNGYYAPVEGVYSFRTPEDRNAFVQELDTAINEEKTSSNRKYSLDNSDTLTYNERRTLDEITDDMTFGDAREVLLKDRNTAVAAALKVYEQTSASRKISKELALQKLREVFENAIRGSEARSRIEKENAQSY